MTGFKFLNAVAATVGILSTLSNGNPLSLQQRETQTTPGTPIKPGTELRILPLGDSITWGYASPDGNGYRLELQNDASADDVVFAGVVQSGNMTDNWNAGYPGKTIQYIGGQAPASLAQSPNIVLLMAGTNDMNSNPAISTEGNDPQAAADRLYTLVYQIFTTLPTTAILLAKIPNVADPDQEARTQTYNSLIPEIVSAFSAGGYHIALVDMSVITAAQLVDGVHPNEAGYQEMGDIWYNGIAALPTAWIVQPTTPDPH